MPIARKELINLEATPYYHIVSRCVRRTFLCGIDNETGRDFSHRKQWIVDRIKYLTKIFAIDIASYAVMSNHYHLVLHVDRNKAKSWTEEDVFARCRLLFRKKAKELEDQADLNPSHPNFLKTLKEWRERLTDISWFMRCLNEPIARRANLEDECKGHFWEGRFKSQALLDEGAVLSAMAYVDLNPVRAGHCLTPEESEYTSIKERIEAYKATKHNSSLKTEPQPSSLMWFNGCTKQQDGNNTIPFKLEHYFRLIDETGKIVRSDKKGFIPKSLAPILDRISIKPKGWLKISKNLESLYANLIGSEHRLMSFAKFLRPPKGISTSRELYI